MVQIINNGMQSEATDIKPEEFAGNTLGGKFGNTLVRFLAKIVNSMTDWFEERLVNFAVGTLIKIEKSGSTIFGRLITELKKYNAIPEFLLPILNEVENPQNEIGALLAQSVGGSAIGGIFGAIFDPLMAPVKYQLNKAMKPYIPTLQEISTARAFGIIGEAEEKILYQQNGFDDTYHRIFTNIYKNQIPFSEAVQLYLRGNIGIGDLNQRIRLLGFNETEATLLENLVIKIPSLNESIIAYFRGDISLQELKEISQKNGVDDTFLNIIISASKRVIELADIRTIFYRTGKPDSWLDDSLGKLGYDSQTIDDLKTIFPTFPPVNDLIRFAVREVYSPDIRSRYGLDDDYPSDFDAEAKKVGLPTDQAKNYWASHWELPSVLMGYEMLHRGIISEEDLKLLMRTLDIMPYWRDKLIQISYNPLTRVDVRRMYGMGVLDVDAVNKAYKDIGYNDENAALMTEFTIKYEAGSEKELTKADILDGYRRKYFSKTETVEYLALLGYDTEEAEYYTAKEDYKEEKEVKENTLKIVEDLYKKGLYDDNMVIAELSKFDYQASEINYYLNKWIIAQIHKPTQPSKDDLKIWLAKRVISKEFFSGEMSNLGYSNTYINIYLKEITGKGLT